MKVTKDDVRVYWLASGAQVIGIVREKTDEEIVLQHPARLMITHEEDGYQYIDLLSAVPYADSNQELLSILTQSIVAISLISDEYFKTYKEYVDDNTPEEKPSKTGGSSGKVVSINSKSPKTI